MGAFEVFTGVLVFAVGGLCELEAGWERSLRWASPGDACHPTARVAAGVGVRMSEAICMMQHIARARGR